jgi:hypothetical protein
MIMNAVEQELETIHLSKVIDIDASLDTTFEALLEELGPGSTMQDGKPLPMVIEAWPGGRWYRDLGNKAGHFWGHVQVIKPPTLLEICGPFFMSYPGVNHVQYRLTKSGNGTQLALIHRAMGQIPAEHKAGVVDGWSHKLNRVREIAESK